MTDQASQLSSRAAVQSDEYPTSLGHDTSYPEHLAPPNQTGHSDDHSTSVPEDGSRSPTSYQSPSLNDKSPVAPEFSPQPGWAWATNTGKEALPRYSNVHHDHMTANDHIEPAEPSPTNSKRKLWIILGVICIVIVLGAALGAGLGIGLKKGEDSNSSPPSTGNSSDSTRPPTTPVKNGDLGSSDYLIGGALNPAYYSTSGAWNGSGIAVANQGFGDPSVYGNMVLYYQYHTGEIRTLVLQPDDSWQQGDSKVAADARNSTPISAVSYVVNQTATWHVFYIGRDNIIREKIGTNTTREWRDGSLTAERLQAFDGDHVGLQACWYGSNYVDTRSQSADEPTVGISLWYAKDNSTFQEYRWQLAAPGRGNWKYTDILPGSNGHAGVACYTWGPGTVGYSMLADEVNDLGIWWRDANVTAKTADHPVNEWAQAQFYPYIRDLHPSSSMGYTNFLFTQRADGRLQGHNISWAVEKTSIVNGEGSGEYRSLTVGVNQGGDEVLNGTHLSVTTISTQSRGSDLTVFAQVVGNDIMCFRRDTIGGSWSKEPLPIPDT
ncbi:hypothetical protein BDZ85DRAFT_264276 [Elsinoe ampelina]|uniref:Uncharacterized protein n=1 Tax=Elsinoe ampelina TaxID=302913 RepID=A0A6A6G7H9_9PEZI|nr:hypothetical protein BDZ85DRAFT_264276 [Elsinoe ampelina]